MYYSDFEVHLEYNDSSESDDDSLDFDIVFEVEGKKLYADKTALSDASPTFKAMLSDRWSSANETIKIKDYKYDDFKNFINSIYSGKCILHRENIFTIIDLAEFYQVPYLKELCDKYLAKLGQYYGEFFKFIETTNRYSLALTKAALQKFIHENTEHLITTDEFLNGNQANIFEFLALEMKQENGFEAIYQWSEFQAIKKQQTMKSSNLNELIKAEMADFLPYFDLKKMRKGFLANFVVDRAFVFTGNVAVEFIQNFTPEVKVKITNMHNHSISGTLSYKTNEDEIEIMKNLNNRYSQNMCDSNIYWRTTSKVPSVPNTLKKRNGVEWYLTYFYDGDIGIQQFSDVNEKRNYLLAEMVVDKKENGFSSTVNCKIEVIE